MKDAIRFNLTPMAKAMPKAAKAARQAQTPFAQEALDRAHQFADEYGEAEAFDDSGNATPALVAFVDAHREALMEGASKADREEAGWKPDESCPRDCWNAAGGSDASFRSYASMSARAIAAILSDAKLLSRKKASGLPLRGMATDGGAHLPAPKGKGKGGGKGKGHAAAESRGTDSLQVEAEKLLQLRREAATRAGELSEKSRLTKGEKELREFCMRLLSAVHVEAAGKGKGERKAA